MINQNNKKQNDWDRQSFDDEWEWNVLMSDVTTMCQPESNCIHWTWRCDCRTTTGRICNQLFSSFQLFRRFCCFVDISRCDLFVSQFNIHPSENRYTHTHIHITHTYDYTNFDYIFLLLLISMIRSLIFFFCVSLPKYSEHVIIDK